MEIFILQIYIYIYIFSYTICCQYLYIMNFKYFSILSFYHQNRSFKIQEIESACSYSGTKLYCRVSIYPFKCTITYNVKNRNSAEDRKCEVCPVDSTRCERNFCFPSNKDKSGTREHERYPWSKLSIETKCKTRSRFLSRYPFAKMYNAWDFERDRSKFHLCFSPRALFVCFSHDDYF